MAGETPSQTLTDPAQARTVPAEDAATEPAPVSDLYELDGELAHGGMGRIWRARDKRLDRPVAVKQLLRATPELIALFEREVRITARLQHPAIVSVYEAGHLPTGEPFFAMKLVAGRSLKEVVRDAGSRDARLALLPSVIAIADALAYAHDQGVIHRDLKPSNVLVGDFGETVVIDWGLAITVDEPAETAGGVVGTPSYMAPEVADGASADARTDVYAIGALLYEVLSGSAPFSGARTDEVLAKVRGGPPPALDRRQPGLPRDLTAIVDKAMARASGDRYPSARELAAELRRFQTGQLVSAHHYSLVERVRRFGARHRAAVAVAAAALLVVVALSVIGVRRIVRERDRARERADRLALAQARQLLDRDPAQALAALRELQPGSHLWGAARVIAADALHRGPGRTVYREQTAPVVAIAVGGGGQLCVVTADGETLRVSRGGRELALPGHSGGALAVAMTGDGGALASVDGDGRVRLWSLADERADPRIDAPATAPAASPTALAIAADGTAVALASRDGSLRVLRIGQPARQLPRRGSPAVRLALSPRWLVHAGSDGALARLDLHSGEQLDLGHERDLRVLEFAPDGERLAIGGGRVLRLLPAAGGAAVEIGHDGELGALAFAPGGRIATGGSDGVVRVWTADGELDRRLAGHRGPVRQLAFSPDGALLISLGEDRAIRLWSAADDQHRAIGGGGGWGSAVRFAGDALLITVGRDNRVRAQPLAGGPAHVLGAHAGPVRALLAPRAASWVASAGDDRTVRRWQLPAGPGRIVGNHQQAVLALAAPDDGRFLISGGADHEVKLWSERGDRTLARAGSAVHTVAVSADGHVVMWAGGEEIGLHWIDGGEQERVTIAGGVTAAALTGDGRLAAAGRRDGGVVLVRLRGPGLVTTDDLGSAGAPVRAIGFSADDRRLAWAADDGSARVAPVGGGVDIELVGHRDLVRALAFAPDGQRLATAGDDGQVRLWDAGTGEGRALARSGWVADVAFSPDGLILASIGSDGRIHLERDELPRDPRALRARIAELAAELAPPREVR